MPKSSLPAGTVVGPRRLWQFIYRPETYYSWLRSRFGPVANMRLPFANLIMTMCAEGARQIFKGNPQHYEAFQKDAFRGGMGEGSIFVMEGAEHQRERKSLMPAFQKQTVHRYSGAINKIVQSHVQHWQPDKEIRAQEAMLAISRDVIMFVVFGTDFERIREEGQVRLAEMLGADHPWVFFVAETQRWWSIPWRRHQRVKRKFFRFLSRVVEARRAEGGEARDVLGRLLAFRNEDGSSKSELEILDELYSILLPGHATTGVAISWALYELSRHPESLARLRQEVDALGPDPDPVQMAKGVFLDAVCKESMRLHTIVTETARLTMINQELLSHEVPEGYGMGVGIHAIHHDPELYPEPFRFHPERFLERDYGPYEFLPFGGGHRRCLGAALSDFEMRLTVATLVAEWDFESLREEKKVRRDLGMGAKYGVRMRVTPRRR